MKALILVLLMWSGAVWAQSRTVDPSDLRLSVRIENEVLPPVAGELVLLSVEGTYRRHVTLESLEQPDLAGFNWFQLGEDQWYEDLERGQRVKKFRRRIALYAQTDGNIEVGPFVHHLTLTDEGDDWFDHPVMTEPVTLAIAPTPPHEGRFFPVRRLRINDDWSNPPDQLNPGEGVLRIIRVEALGASPDMLPPMPDLRSPSAMVFAHPEKRLVELSPFGPVSIAFWRWTIQPTNGISGILEPIELSYFDTLERKTYDVSIGAQRVAYSRAARVPDDVSAPPVRTAATIPLWGRAAVLFAAFAAGLAVLARGRGRGGAMRMRLAALRGDAAGVRRAAGGQVSGVVAGAARARLDATLFGAAAPLTRRELWRIAGDLRPGGSARPRGVAQM